MNFLAVIGSKRAPAPYDNVPTLREVGIDVTFEIPQVIIGPPKMPKAVTDKLVKVFKEASHDPDFHRFLAERNSPPFYLHPDQAITYLNEMRKSYRDIMEKAGILKEK